MRSRLHPALLLALLAVAAATAIPQEPAIYDVTVARVVRFADADLTRMTRALVTRHVDGDTFVVRIDNPPPGPGASERVRLIGIDTPERGEPWADDATQHVANRIGADPCTWRSTSGDATASTACSPTSTWPTGPCSTPS